MVLKVQLCYSKFEGLQYKIILDIKLACSFDVFGVYFRIDIWNLEGERIIVTLFYLSLSSNLEMMYEDMWRGLSVRIKWFIYLKMCSFCLVTNWVNWQKLFITVNTSKFIFDQNRPAVRNKWTRFPIQFGSEVGR